MDIHIETWVFPLIITVVAAVLAVWLTCLDDDPWFTAFGGGIKFIIWTLASLVSTLSWLLWALLR